MAFPLQAMQGGGMAEARGGLGNFVNLFWPNFARWSCILWDPKRFPEMAYEMSKKHGEAMKEAMLTAPWHQRMMFRFAMPKSFSAVKDMRKMGRIYGKMTKGMGMGMVEYDEDASRTDEHYFRIRENPDCWGFENLGTPMAYLLPPGAAGMCKGIESWRGLERDWNAVETKCIGLGDPYCEFKLVPGEIPELRASLGKDSTVLDGMHDRLMGRLMGFLLEGKPLVERSSSGSDEMISSILHVLVQPALAGERYRVVMRMAGAKAGKEVGEHLMEAGVEGDDAVDRVVKFLEYCKVGKVTVGETIRMEESCESVFYRFMTRRRQEPCCYYTTGFVNGFFSTVKDQHVRETRCIAMGDPYCEWELR
jgi:predicted hydrocarbon binding protein